MSVGREFQSPDELLEAYEQGFQGSIFDREDYERLMGELPRPEFGAAAEGIAGSGAGRVSLPFKSVLQFDSDAYTERQTTGDCVSHSTRNAADLSRAVDIHITREAEGWHARGATEAIYGSRGHAGQGMSCSTAARFVSSTGGLLLRKNYGFVDLSRYDGSIGTKWGGRDVPEDVRKVAAQHQVRTVSVVRTVEEARDALANGYGISVCSGYGFSDRRDEEGFAKRRGGWSHAMAWIGCDDEHARPGFLVQNSWGKWNDGPKRNGQPDGSFWIDFEVAEGMLRGGGAFALSNVDGFPPQRLPDYGSAAFL